MPLEALGAEDVEAIRAARECVVEDVASLAEPSQVVRILAPAGLRSYVRLPMAFEGRVIGTLVLASDRTGSFDAEQLEIARQVVDQLAIAIRQAMLFNQVRSGRERMRTLSRQLLRAQEEERRRIARELHDEIGQSLTAVRINLQRAMASRGPEFDLALPEESDELIDRVLQQVRHISLDLRPSMLDDLGLAASMRSHLDRTARLAGFVGHFTADPPEIRLPPEIETECFRIAQEALTNVVRHAGARQVDVALSRHAERLDLVVHDDGAGFDVAAARQHAARGGSLGLLGMQERAALLGGRITIEARPGLGTKVHLRVPWPPMDRRRRLPWWIGNPLEARSTRLEYRRDTLDSRHFPIKNCMDSHAMHGLSLANIAPELRQCPRLAREIMLPRPTTSSAVSSTPRAARPGRRPSGMPGEAPAVESIKEQSRGVRHRLPRACRTTSSESDFAGEGVS